MLSYKHYINTVARTVSKHTTTDMLCYHINIKTTKKRVKSVNTQLKPCHINTYILNYHSHTYRQYVRDTARGCYHININLIQTYRL
jgi:hypothetical protein